MVPFASGAPVVLNSLINGAAGVGGLIGFGLAAPSPSVLGLNLDLTGGLAGPVINFAFSVPRDGVITDLAAYFSVTVGVTLGVGTHNVVAQLYESTAPNNQFTQIAGARVVLPFTGLINLGDFASGITDLNVPVTAGTRLLLAFALETTGLTVVSALTGYASAGLSIAFD